MVRHGGEIENCYFDKEKDSKVGLFGIAFLLRYKAFGVLKNFGERFSRRMWTASFKINCSLLGAESTIEKQFLEQSMPQIVADVGKYVSSCPYSDAHELC